MKTEELPGSLLQFVVNNRRSGTTTLIKKIVEQNDIWVIVPNQESKELFGDCALSIYEIDKALGLPRKPILIDNGALIKLLDVISAKITEQSMDIDRQNKLIGFIKRALSDFEITIPGLSVK